MLVKNNAQDDQFNRTAKVASNFFQVSHLKFLMKNLLELGDDSIGSACNEQVIHIQHEYESFPFMVHIIKVAI